MSLGTRGSVRREAKGLFRSEGAKAARLRRRGAKVCLEVRRKSTDKVRRKSTDKESMNKGPYIYIYMDFFRCTPIRFSRFASPLSFLILRAIE